MNAIAHAAEGLYARDGNRVMSLMAEEGIRAMVSALPSASAAAISMRAGMRCMARGFAERCWAAWARRCTTSGARGHVPYRARGGNRHRGAK